MNRRALRATSQPLEVRDEWLSELEQQAKNIAGAMEWDKVQEAARRAPALPPSLATYVFDAATRQAFHAAVPPLEALAVDGWVTGVVVIEAASPTYLELPPILARFANDARFLEARSSGRLLYRKAMYREVFAEIDEVQLARAIQRYGQEAVMKVLEAWDGEKYRLEYAPCRLERQAVFDVIECIVLPRDRRQAVFMPLACRVGMAVGFLSALSVAQPREAQEGMMILSVLAAPLLGQEVSVGERPALKFSRGRRKGKGKRSRRSSASTKR